MREGPTRKGIVAIRRVTKYEPLTYTYLALAYARAYDTTDILKPTALIMRKNISVFSASEIASIPI